MRRLNGSVGSGDGYAKIHASLAGCDDSFLILLKNIYAKIHASLARCDPLIDTFTLSCFMLKSTHPLRDATGDGYYLVHIKGAKIHASLARCDRKI